MWRTALEWRDREAGDLHFNSQSCHYGHRRQIVCIFLDGWLNSGFDTWLLALPVGPRRAIKANDSSKQFFSLALISCRRGLWSRGGREVLHVCMHQRPSAQRNRLRPQSLPRDKWKRGRGYGKWSGRSAGSKDGLEEGRDTEAVPGRRQHMERPGGTGENPTLGSWKGKVNLQRNRRGGED